MTGARIVEVLRESAAAVLRTHGIDPASVPLEEMSRNAAAILHAELQAEEEEAEIPTGRGPGRDGPCSSCPLREQVSYVCAGCKRRVPNGFGAADDMPDHCDDCWTAHHRPELAETVIRDAEVA